LHVLPRWRGRLMRDITRRDVLDLLDRVVDTGKPIAANRVFSAIRKMFNWAVARDIIATSPCAGVKPPSAERSRDRVLSDDELRLVWRAADKIGGPFGALVKLLTLTGQRRDEVARARWSEIDLDGRVWTLAPERVKKGINLPVIEKVLGHASGSFAGIVGVYQKHSFADEKRNALDAWGAFVADLVSDRPRRNIVRLHKRGGHA
jgi:integrase